MKLQALPLRSRLNSRASFSGVNPFFSMDRRMRNSSSAHDACLAASRATVSSVKVAGLIDGIDAAAARNSSMTLLQAV
ncbi:hypothetical protein [Methylosinus sp. 3S-1]|uniref:hypothetical protein n=1 Tax=Methylosinus sp. 3S-1 TaxID=1849840 RepID=UPI0012EA9A3B|nr:hypothetical protein [Methylosinus sp. 3S-1]